MEQLWINCKICGTEGQWHLNGLLETWMACWSKNPPLHLVDQVTGDCPPDYPDRTVTISMTCEGRVFACKIGTCKQSVGRILHQNNRS